MLLPLCFDSKYSSILVFRSGVALLCLILVPFCWYVFFWGFGGKLLDIVIASEFACEKLFLQIDFKGPCLFLILREPMFPNWMLFGKKCAECGYSLFCIFVWNLLKDQGEVRYA